LPRHVIGKILVPVDGSEYALKAAEYAVDFAKMVKAKLVVLHVLHLPSYVFAYPSIEGASGVTLPQALPASVFEEEKKAAENLVRKVKEMAEKAGVNAETAIIERQPSVPDAIIDFAMKSECDLIVMGSKGRTGIKRFLLGSVTESVVHHAHCPVLVVR